MTPDAWQPITTSASFHLCPQLAEAPAEPRRQKTHQKNLIYYKKKQTTKHISATLKRCLGRRSKGCAVCATTWFLPSAAWTLPARMVVVGSLV